MASGGSRRRSSWRVLGESSASRRPRLTAVSVAMMAGPPALVRIPSRFPRGRGFLEKPRVKSKSSSTVFTRITPDCSRSASAAMSRPWRAESAPVCDMAAFAPASVRPDFTARMGLRFEMRREICMKRFMLPIDSRYIRIRSVFESFSQ